MKKGTRKGNACIWEEKGNGDGEGDGRVVDVRKGDVKWELGRRGMEKNKIERRGLRMAYLGDKFGTLVHIRVVRLHAVLWSERPVCL